MAFPDLSQATEDVELRANAEDDGRTVEDLPEGGGTVEHVTAPMPAVVQAQDLSAEDPEKVLDLAGQQSTISDLKLMEVYGDTTHRNDGRHLCGGIAGDEVWQRYDRVVANHTDSTCHPKERWERLWLPPMPRS